MIDKADLRVVAGTAIRGPVRRIIDRIEADPGRYARDGTLKKTANYKSAVNLTAFGIPALLHRECTRGKPNHKLEILGTGDRTLTELRGIVDEVFALPSADSLGIMRADLTADVKDTAVPWFREHCYITHKRIRRQIGHIPASPWMAVQDAVCETFYAGKAPNQLRVYDKVGERRHRWMSEARRAWNKEKKLYKEAYNREMYNVFALGEDPSLLIAGVELWEETIAKPIGDRMPHFPTFAERFGHGPDAVITRVERRCQGRDLDLLELTTFDDLKRLHLVQPFRKLQFFQDRGEPDPGQWKPTDYLAGMQLREIAQRDGVEAAKLQVRRLFGEGNHRRAWGKFLPFIGAGGGSKAIDGARLQLEYELSTLRQLAA
jgi:hypothetical protein